VQSISTGKRTTIIEGASNGRYLLTGHLSYTLAGNVLAVPFDLQTLSVGKSGVPIIQGIRRSTTVGVAQFAVSKSGTLAYIPGSTTFAGRARMFVITDRKSSTRSLPLPAAPYRYPRVSHDGKYAAVAIDDGREVYISIFDLATNGALRRITFDGHDRFPTWSGDSQWIAFQSDREGDLGIFMRRADGSSPRGERLTKPETGVAHIPESWSPDGRILLFSKRNGTAYSLWSLSLENKKVVPFDNVQSAVPINATFSPDGHWVAYAVNDRGGGTTSPNRGIYVEPFPATGARYQVPKEFNDFHPTWSPTMAELFYLPRATQFSAVSIQMTLNVRFGKAVSLPTLTLDRVSIDVRDYDVLPDGRFLSTVPAEDDTASRTAEAPQIRVVLNWFRELQERVPVK